MARKKHSKQAAAKYRQSKTKIDAEGEVSPTPSPIAMIDDHLRKQPLVGKYFADHNQDEDRSRTASPSSEAEAEEEISVDEELVSAGAKATLGNTARRLFQEYRSETMKELEELQQSEVELESEQSSEEASEPDIENVQRGQPGFPAPDDLPFWFPENIKRIYSIDRHGGALKFKELDEITRYRAALERIHRRKWRTYIAAGKARWSLQQAIRKLRARPFTKTFLEYRKKQYEHWKGRALKAWKTLEKTHAGVRMLDETIDINFRQERIIYGMS